MAGLWGFENLGPVRPRNDLSGAIGAVGQGIAGTFQTHLKNEAAAKSAAEQRAHALSMLEKEQAGRQQMQQAGFGHEREMFGMKDATDREQFSRRMALEDRKFGLDQDEYGNKQSEKLAQRQIAPATNLRTEWKDVADHPLMQTHMGKVSQLEADSDFRENRQVEADGVPLFGFEGQPMTHDAGLRAKHIREDAQGDLEKIAQENAQKKIQEIRARQRPRQGPADDRWKFDHRRYMDLQNELQAIDRPERNAMNIFMAKELGTPLEEINKQKDAQRKTIQQQMQELQGSYRGSPYARQFGIFDGPQQPAAPAAPMAPAAPQAKNPAQVWDEVAASMPGASEEQIAAEARRRMSGG